jgi:hypothetical protein
MGAFVGEKNIYVIKIFLYEVSKTKNTWEIFLNYILYTFYESTNFLFSLQRPEKT